MASKKRRALGRGLDKLIPTVSVDDKDSSNGIDEVEISSIKVNPFQPRLDFVDSEIENLAESIKNQGLLQPIVLRKIDDNYQIISGERRFRAFKFLKKDRVPAIIKVGINDTEMLEMALVENIQRENLSDVEVAISYQKLLFDCGLSHKQLSERVGKSRSGITNTLRLLKLPDSIQQMIRGGKISSGHGRALLSIDDKKEQLSIADKIVSDKLSVREVENCNREDNTVTQESTDKDSSGSKKNTQKEKVVKERDADLVAVEEKLRFHFGTDVKLNVDNSTHKGKIEINCYEKSDLNRIIDMILK